MEDDLAILASTASPALNFSFNSFIYLLFHNKQALLHLYGEVEIKKK